MKDLRFVSTVQPARSTRLPAALYGTFDVRVEAESTAPALWLDEKPGVASFDTRK